MNQGGGGCGAAEIGRVTGRTRQDGSPNVIRSARTTHATTMAKIMEVHLKSIRFLVFISPSACDSARTTKLSDPARGRRRWPPELSAKRPLSMLFIFPMAGFCAFLYKLGRMTMISASVRQRLKRVEHKRASDDQD